MNVFDFLKFAIEEEHKQINTIIDDLDESTLTLKIADNATLGDRLRHISSAEFRMAGYIVDYDDGDLEIDPTSLQSIKIGFQKSKERHLNTLSQLKEEDLEKEWISPHSGKSYTYKWLVYHFLEHISTHRGQVAMVIRQNKSE
ncbi:MAG: DinB family protein [Candidatus Heimdallarchaeota archaeon]|nr:DinB family protein [Candidatus Heimdallarchaeota archaeon]